MSLRGGDIAQVVLQSDFGLGDGAVCAMRGVICNVDPSLRVSDLTHNIPVFSCWDASYRLFQTIKYWPENTVFVSVVDPGVGSLRKSVVAKVADQKYVVSPDNGTLSHLKAHGCIREVREINEITNRLKGSEDSHTFHGRDIYAYTAGRIAAGVIVFEEVGSEYSVSDIVQVPLFEMRRTADSLIGNVDIADIHFGNIWSNVPADAFKDMGHVYGDVVDVAIIDRDTNTELYCGSILFGRTFTDAPVGSAIVYINSLGYASVAINQGDFTHSYHVNISRHPMIKFIRKSR